MAAKLLLLVACLALSHAALVKRDAPASSLMDDIQKHAAEFQKTFSESINSFFNSKNVHEGTETFKQSSDSLLQQLGTFSSSLQTAISDASGKAKEVLETSKANIERAAEDLRKSHPEVEQQASDFKQRIDNAVQTTLQESQKIAKEVGESLDQTNQKLSPQIKAAYDNFVQKVSEMQKTIHEAANKQ